MGFTVRGRESGQDLKGVMTGLSAMQMLHFAVQRTQDHPLLRGRKPWLSPTSLDLAKWASVNEASFSPAFNCSVL